MKCIKVITSAGGDACKMDLYGRDDDALALILMVKRSVDAGGERDGKITIRDANLPTQRPYNIH